jgi:hypothetical protein
MVFFLIPCVPTLSLFLLGVGEDLLAEDSLEEDLSSSHEWLGSDSTIVSDFLDSWDTEEFGLETESSRVILKHTPTNLFKIKLSYKILIPFLKGSAIFLTV